MSDKTSHRIPKATVQRRLEENNRNSGALWTFKQQLVNKVRVRYVKVTIANFGIRQTKNGFIELMELSTKITFVKQVVLPRK